MAVRTVVYTAADYVVNCFEQEWWVAGQQRDWRTVRNEPVKHRDLLNTKTP